MRENLLLDLTHEESSIQIRGNDRNIGEEPTMIRIEPLPLGARISILGSEVALEPKLTLKAPLLFEHTEYSIYLRGPNPRRLICLPAQAVAQLRYSDEHISHYAVNYGSAVGNIALEWQAADNLVRLQLEVFPTKLDYRKDFEAIKSDLRRLSNMLLSDLRGVTGDQLSSSELLLETHLEWIEQVRREAATLQASMRDLLPRLRKQVRDGELVVPSDRLRGRHPVRPKDAAALNISKFARSLLVRSASLSENTPLNGHLRWEIEQFIAVADQVVRSEWFFGAPEEITRIVAGALREAVGWRTSLAEISPVPELPNLQTRLRDPFYARAFASLRRLRLGLQQSDSPELLGLKDIWLLYEYWVYLQLVERLRAKYSRVLSASSSLVKELGAQVYLVKGIESKIVLQDAAGQRVACYYSRAFNELPTTNQKPDITIEKLESGEMIVIDAKYRLARSPEYLERYGLPGPDEEDINVLHRYRDAIIALPGSQRRVVGGLIAFPGANDDEFRRHHFFKSLKVVAIGAAPLLPGRTSALDEALVDLLGN